MRKTEEIRLAFFDCQLCIRRELRLRKALPNIIDSHGRRMHHIGRIKTVVSELIKHQFVSGKIRPILLLHELLGRQKEGRFRELILVESVLDMADRRNGNQHFFLPHERMLKEYGVGADNLLNSESPAEETGGGQFVAIPHDLSLHFIYPSRSPGEDQSVGFQQCHPSFIDTLVDHPEAVFRIGRREFAVVEHGVVEAAGEEQVFF